jgi:hypothetical protein
MTSEEYRETIQATLATHSESALAKLTAIKQSMPEKAKGVAIGIHPGQSEEGFFDVVVHLDGPDLFVLNKAINAHRFLFEVKVVDGEVTPDVPMFEPDEVNFSVNDLIVDTCMEWVELLWLQLGGIGRPALVFGEEGYGSLGSKPLRP